MTGAVGPGHPGIEYKDGSRRVGLSNLNGTILTSTPFSAPLQVRHSAPERVMTRSGPDWA